MARRRFDAYISNDMNQSVAVHFKKEFPVFPLPETMLLPHAMMPLSIFEPRYIQLADHALDSSGQLAIATYHPEAKLESNMLTPLRDVVCLAQIVQHEKVSQGYNVLVYGLCRACILEETAPNDETLYRSAKLKPLEGAEGEVDDQYRDELQELLHRPNLQQLDYVSTVEQWINEPDLTTHALFELIGCSIFEDAELRYSLLAEPSSEVRTMKVLSELNRLDKLIEMTRKQSQDKWSDGLSWN